MTVASPNCSPGSHPHADRPNWQAAKTLDEYLQNCRDGLEAYSDRQAAKLMGISRTRLWRWKLLAELPEDLFERLVTELDHLPSNRELACIARALLGQEQSPEIERCPHCHGVLRVRGRWRDSTAKVVNNWLRTKETRL
jgi:hypothetical protein